MPAGPRALEALGRTPEALARTPARGFYCVWPGQSGFENTFIYSKPPALPCCTLLSGRGPDLAYGEALGR